MPLTPAASLVILGSGMAGYQLATELRRLGDDRPILMLTQDGGEAYSKPLLSTALAKKQQPEQLIQATAHEQAKRLQIEIRHHRQVQAIDREQHTLLTEQGLIRYDQLVLATGAEALAPRLTTPSPEGALLSINDLDDYRRFRQQLTADTPVVVLGGGLVGVEMTQDLLNAGHSVSLLARSANLLPGLVPAAVAAPLQWALQQQGLKQYLNTSATSISGQPGQWQVNTDQHQTLDAGLIISATGLRPRIQLAQQAGLDCGRGIRVNRQLQTSDPDIHALGDCAEIDGLNLMYVQPLMASARMLASLLHGDDTAHLSLEALPVLVKTSRCPVVAATPPAGSRGEWQFSGDEEGMEGQFLDAQGQLLGFALSGKAVRQKARLTRLLPPLLA
ncbi:FAD-dependent oxidoreductase [Marinospirillum alkaliphilum]|uniref:Rubredoxin-NAD+ reductase n=1 Tax=Marinospirillum alkaliphilum DSM 21637 TaxID=1122209 RepID=A0A1K1WKL7_9GAMM|nr:FAD-dependent oxidoreductase [Marinospirillum alkaliphilum]SFX37954.1 rubredoxin-NAD+ reductase [Marinospirillum alkaliphilum DSM 21637]